MLANVDGEKQAIPGWLLTPDIVTYKLPPVGSGKVRTIVLPWDPKVQPKILAFIAKAGERYDGKIDYIAMGGLGDVIESYIVPDPATIGLTLTDAIAKWTGSSTAIVEAHATAFHQTAFIFTLSRPFDGSVAMDAGVALVTTMAKKYPQRFGVMDCSLNAHANDGYPPHALVKQFSGTNPDGLQFLCSEKGFGGHTLGGTFAETLDAAISLGAHFIEIYADDARNPANADKIRATSAQLK